MSPALFRDLIIVPTLSAMREGRVHDRATLLIAIAIQESGLTCRRQTPRGPARSWWQIEPLTAIDTLQRYPSAQRLVSELGYHVRRGENISAILEWCDAGACAIAAGIVRLCPLALPAIPLSAPIVGAKEECWRYYLRAWRPGKPRPERWGEAFGSALKAMTGESVLISSNSPGLPPASGSGDSAATGRGGGYAAPADRTP